MKKTILTLLGLLICLAIGLVAGEHNARAVAVASVAAVDAHAVAPAVAPQDAEMLKSCTHDSECPYGGCSGGACGSCSNNSDCKGYGGCSNHQCGSCSNKSDCGKFGDCNSGHCSKSPY